MRSTRKLSILSAYIDMFESNDQTFPVIHGKQFLHVGNYVYCNSMLNNCLGYKALLILKFYSAL